MVELNQSTSQHVALLVSFIRRSIIRAWHQFVETEEQLSTRAQTRAYPKVNWPKAFFDVENLKALVLLLLIK